jgi:hypothetical protein
MNKPLVFSGIAVIVLSASIYSWTHSTPTKVTKDQTVAQNEAKMVNDIAPAAGGQATMRPSPQPIVTPPAVTTAKPPITAQQPTDAAQPAPTDSSQAQKPSDLPPEELAAIQKDLKSELETKFKDKLSFPIDEPKIIAYAQASLKVKKINNKWDVQIAGADSDKMAIEYNNFSVEEITKSLQSMSGLTLDQYNEITKLTASDAEFNNIYQVYKQMIEEGIIATPAAAASPVPVPLVAAPVVAAPVATPPVQPASTPTTAVAPVNFRTKPMPQGSLMPPYSPPASH